MMDWKLATIILFVLLLIFGSVIMFNEDTKKLKICNVNKIYWMNNAFDCLENWNGTLNTLNMSMQIIEYYNKINCGK